MHYAIRRAARSDSPEIARLQVDSYQRAYAGLFPPAYLDHFTYAEETQDWVTLLERADPEEALWVAAGQEDGLLGYALVRTQSNVYPGYAAEIVALHVAQPVQQQRIGTALLRTAVQDLLARGHSTVMLWTLYGNPARQWYERLQGRILGEKHYLVDDWEIVEVAYGWDHLADLRVRLAIP